MDVEQANELYELAYRMAAEATRLRDALETEFLSQQITGVVDDDYDLGRVVSVEQVLGGYVNLSFAVVTRAADGEHRYFVRKYNRYADENEICFEHALTCHINSRDHIAAEVYPNKLGRTLVTREELLDGQRIPRFFAVYELLGGEDRYTWVKNRCTDAEFESGGRMLARFHALAHDFDPGGFARHQPPIMEFLRTLGETFTSCADRAADTKFGECLFSRLPGVFEVLRKGAAIEPRLAGMPYIPVHCDYHPGNLKWVGEEAVALFDFDWSKLDYRLFDVAEGIVYFCSSWEGPDDGEIRLDKARLFVRAYQEEAARYAVPGPMSEAELACLPRMVANANLYVLNWDITAYDCARDPDVDEYLFFLTHQLAFMEYIEAHQDELAALAASAATVGVASSGSEGGGSAA